MIWGVAKSALLVYAVLVVVLYLAQRSLLYVPDRTMRAPPAGVETITYTTQDGLDLTGWLLLPPTAASNNTVIVYFQGNGGHMIDRTDSFPKILESGFAIFLVGYRGYAGNPGSPSEQGLYADARAAIDIIRTRYKNIVLMGESLGTGIAVQMALENSDAAALILESPYKSIPSVAQTHYGYVPFLPYLIRDKFDTLSKAPRLSENMPKLVLVAEQDRVIPPEQSETVYKALTTPKNLKLYGAAHVQLMSVGGQDGLLDFLQDFITL